MSSIDKVSRVLRVDKDVLRELERKAEALTNRKNVIDKIAEENLRLIENRLQLKGLEADLRAEEIYDGLVDKIKEDDLQLFKSLGKPSFMLEEDVRMVLEKVKELVPSEIQQGLFLKKDKAAELLKKNPPRKVIEYLGYKSVEELIEREDIFEVFAAIRLFEDKDWFNDVFVKEYLGLAPQDFETRPIVFHPLSQKWVGIAQSFLKKKYQNISHLKELGIIFVVPTELGMPGETTRMFSLALHYFFEVRFYSDLFERFSQDAANFGKNVADVLIVKPIDTRLPATEKLRFLILPSYLAKYDENDWRLFEPHVSPEVIFWEKAEAAMRGLNTLLKDHGTFADFSFWENLDWVGDYFQTATGIEVLVSFNFVDTTMSLLKAKELIKYLYHHQESLWNKIFTEYFGADALEEYLKANMIQGYFEL